MAIQGRQRPGQNPAYRPSGNYSAAVQQSGAASRPRAWTVAGNPRSRQVVGSMMMTAAAMCEEATARIRVLLVRIAIEVVMMKVAMVVETAAPPEAVTVGISAVRVCVVRPGRIRV